MDFFPAARRRSRVVSAPPARGSARSRTHIRRPRGFAKGVLVGILALIPLVAVAIYGCAAAGLGSHRPEMIDTLRLATIFAGVPGLVTAGGVGRLAAEASLDGGRPRAMWVAGRAMAFAGGALVVIGAIACEVIPGTTAGWIALPASGLVAGAAAGVVVGLACGGPMPTLTELGVWRADVNLSAAVERVMTKAIRRARDTRPPDDGAP